jgi:hypothetical protein
MSAPVSRKRKIIRRVLWLALIAMLPPLAITIAYFWGFRIERDKVSAVTAFYGSLWGLSTGILLRSLPRALIGLNLGAALGLAVGEVLHNCNVFNYNFLAFFFFSGAVLGTAMKVKKPNLVSSLIWGAAVGFLSFFIMYVVLMSIKSLDDHFNCGNWLLFPIALLPWPAGVAFFFFGIVDCEVPRWFRKLVFEKVEEK